MSILEFGKYKNREIKEVFAENPNYCHWLFKKPMTQNYKDIYKFLDENLKNKNTLYLTFGKHKNKSLDWIAENDKKYILYLKGNEFVQNKLPELAKLVNQIQI